MCTATKDATALSTETMTSLQQRRPARTQKPQPRTVSPASTPSWSPVQQCQQCGCTPPVQQKAPDRANLFRLWRVEFGKNFACPVKRNFGVIGGLPLRSESCDRSAGSHHICHLSWRPLTSVTRFAGTVCAIYCSLARVLACCWVCDPVSIDDVVSFGELDKLVFPAALCSFFIATLCCVSTF
jgi:hypothetical protein